MLTAKLKGGALYIALIICLVISIILSVFILMAHFNQKQLLALQAHQQLFLSLQSAFNVSQSHYLTEEQNNRWQKLNASDDSVKIKTLQWGAYLLVETQAKNNRQVLSQTGLFGSFATPDTALYVVDSDRPIGLAGMVDFKAAAYFPKAGVKTAFIDGAGSSLSSQSTSFIRTSGKQMKPCGQQFNERLLATLNKVFESTDSLAGLERGELNQPFSARTLVISSGNLNLAGYKLSNNIKLVARHEIVVDESSQLDNVLLVAPKVRISKGFKGTVQVIASDSIIVGDGCLLTYPSSLTLISHQSTDTRLKGIFVGEQCRVEGSLLAINHANEQSRVIVCTKKDCVVYGLVYSSDYAGFQGNLFGTLYCSKLLLQTPSAVYENHLMNCSIDPKKYVSGICYPALFESDQANQWIKRL